MKLATLPPINRTYTAAVDFLTDILLKISPVRIKVHAIDDKPMGSSIIALNHFTRFETIFIPKVMYTYKHLLIRSLADDHLFANKQFSRILGAVGVLPIKAPNRNSLIATDLALGGTWMIFPEGSMIKDKKVYHGDKYMIYSYSKDQPYREPHTGTAVIAMEAQKYKEDLRGLFDAKRFIELRTLAHTHHIGEDELFERVFEDVAILPVNISYFPHNFGSRDQMARLIDKYMPALGSKIREELIFDTTLLRYGVDIDIRFEDPIRISDYVEDRKLASLKNVFSYHLKDEAGIDWEEKRVKAKRIMEKYMKKIYFSTTINLSNIASELLLAMHGEHGVTSLALQEFRQRIYLAIKKLAKIKGVHIHSTLKDKKVRLGFLYQQEIPVLDSFLLSCTTAGLLIVQGDRVELLPKISAEPDFQEIRLAHPVRVASNEIQPLRKVVEIIRQYAASAIGEGEHREFAADILAYEQSIYSNAHDVFRRRNLLDVAMAEHKDFGAPQLLAPKQAAVGRSGTAIVCIHGMGACPAYVAEMGERLAREGHPVFLPRLAGHGTSPVGLKSKRIENFLGSVERAIAMFAMTHQHIVLVGFGLGGWLALRAAEIHAVSRVVFVTDPLEGEALDLPFPWLLKIARPFVAQKHSRKSTGEEIQRYSSLPVATVQQYRSLVAEVFDHADKLRSALLICGSEADSRSVLHNCELLLRKSAAANKRSRRFPVALYADGLGHEVQREIVEFCARVLEPA